MKQTTLPSVLNSQARTLDSQPLTRTFFRLRRMAKVNHYVVERIETKVDAEGENTVEHNPLLFTTYGEAIANYETRCNDAHLEPFSFEDDPNN